MRRTLSMAGLAVLVVCGGLAGCTRPAVREKALPDPLLTSKKPIEGKAHLADSGPAAGEEIPPPPPPPPPDAARSAFTPDVPVVQLLGRMQGR